MVLWCYVVVVLAAAAVVVTAVVIAVVMVVDAALTLLQSTLRCHNNGAFDRTSRLVLFSPRYTRTVSRHFVP